MSEIFNLICNQICQLRDSANDNILLIYYISNQTAKFRVNLHQVTQLKFQTTEFSCE